MSKRHSGKLVAGTASWQFTTEFSVRVYCIVHQGCPRSNYKGGHKMTHDNSPKHLAVSVGSQGGLHPRSLSLNPCVSCAYVFFQQTWKTSEKHREGTMLSNNKAWKSLDPHNLGGNSYWIERVCEFSKNISPLKPKCCNETGHVFSSDS